MVGQLCLKKSFCSFLSVLRCVCNQTAVGYLRSREKKILLSHLTIVFGCVNWYDCDKEENLGITRLREGRGSLPEGG